jgi:exosortase E/protease (VPEID-CTERM system)
MAWAAGLITEGWWDPLRHATMVLVAMMVSVIAPDAVFVPGEAVAGTERFWVHISSACAGYEGIGLIWTFLSAYLVACRDRLRFPHALLLIPIGTLAVWFCNALRVTALIAIGTWISEDVAMGGFHSYSGSILFSGVALAIVWAVRRSSFFTIAADEEPAEATAGTHNVTAAYLVPFLAIVATQMVAGAMSAGGGLDLFYPARVVAAGAARDSLPHGYPAIRWTCSWEAVAMGIVVFVIWMALEPTPDAAKQAAFGEALGRLSPVAAALWLTFRVIGSVVTVPATCTAGSSTSSSTACRFARSRCWRSSSRRCCSASCTDGGSPARSRACATRS